MRIVAGTMRGRRIEAPKGETTRPTTDRVREALFSSLAARSGEGLGGRRVLDLFAGSGALGLEALSRGCAHATFVEKDRAALTILKRNIDTLGVTRESTVLSGDSFALAKRPPTGGPFGLLLLDPPYRIPSAEVRQAISDLAAAKALTADALVMWEHGTGTDAEWPDGFSEVTSKRYGDTTVSIAVWEGEGQ